MSQPDADTPPTGDTPQAIKLSNGVMTAEQFLEHEHREYVRGNLGLQQKEEHQCSQHEYRQTQECRELIKELAKRTTMCDSSRFVNS